MERMRAGSGEWRGDAGIAVSVLVGTGAESSNTQLKISTSTPGMTRL